MSSKHLSEEKAGALVEKFMGIEGSPVTTQTILNSGSIPGLRGFVVRHGKVSDCIFGGKGDFIVPAKEEGNYQNQLSGLSTTFASFTDPEDNKVKIRISFENPPLRTKEGTDFIAMARTGRISSHDIERGNIPFKDQILAMNHEFMRQLVMPFLGSSQFELGMPANSVVIGAEQVTGMDYENVLRAYMAKSSTKTSLYHAYMNEGQRSFAGYDLPDNLYPNGPTPCVMDTPSTKSDLHDETVAPKRLFELGICSPQEYFRLRNDSLAALGAVAGFLRTRNIIIADTKTEHGYDSRGVLKSKDELYTMDSSRFWLLDDYLRQQALFLAGKEKELVKYLKQSQPSITEEEYIVNDRVIMVPRSYSKEFARGFAVKDQEYTDEQRAAIAVRYIMGIQHLLQRRFEPDMRPWHERVTEGLQKVVEQIL